MRILVDIVSVAIGLGLGGFAGYAIGRRFEDDRRMLWTLAIAAFTSAWVLDLAGYISGRPEVSIGSIGLMAGLVTGVKYGGFPPLGRRTGTQGEHADEDAASPEDAAPEEDATPQEHAGPQEHAPSSDPP